jgi:proteasome assembly chaperone (PAC2) family protein
MYISTGALVTENIPKEPKIHICSTDKALIDSFLKLKNTTVMEGGIIAGANGILPAWAGKKGYAPGVCLLAETIPLPMMNFDPRASKALVILLKNYFNIEINFDELDKKISEMQGIFDSFKKQADYFVKSPQEDTGPDSYFR